MPLNKKIITILLICLLFIMPLILTVIQAQETPPGLPSELAQNPDELIGQYKNKTQTKFDYLSKEWKTIILKNQFIASLDSFFTKISIVFQILFNMPYSLNITLFIIIFLWLFFALELGRFVQKGISMNNWLAFVIGAGISIILAQLNFFLIITQFLSWLIFAQKGWVWNLCMIAIIILVFIFLYYFGEILIKWLEARKKKRKEQEIELTWKSIKAWFKGFTEAQK